MRAICTAAFRDCVTHIDLVAKLLDIIEPKPERLVSPHAGKRSRIGQRVTHAAQLLRRADECPDLFRCRRHDLTGFQWRKLEPHRWIVERETPSHRAGPPFAR